MSDMIRIQQIVGDVLRAARPPEKVKLKYASDCPACTMCGEPWCVDCEEHYAECSCPGPHSECDVCENGLWDCLCDGGPTYDGQPVEPIE